MKIIQSTIERLLYIGLLLMFIVASIAAIAATLDYQQLTRQQRQFHDQSLNNLNVIKQNQVNQTIATKEYIACILAINPKGNLHAQENACFDKAPSIKR